MEPVRLTKGQLHEHVWNMISDNADGLWCLGNKDLLNRKGLSFCGSRKPSEQGILAARQCARQAVELGLVCISGNAAGVDLCVHHAALERGGDSIFVIPEGIENFRIRHDLREVWDWDRCLVVSQFQPKARWQIWRAMTRNKLIIGLGLAMIVIEAGETGGTQEAANQTMKMGKPLFAVQYEKNPIGNQAIIDRGAKRLKRDKNTKRPNIEAVLGIAENFEPHIKKGQMDLPLV
jgi:DNA processing protein